MATLVKNITNNNKVNKKNTTLSDVISSKAKDVISFLFDSENTSLGHLKEHFQIVALNRQNDFYENEVPFTDPDAARPKVNRTNSGEVTSTLKKIKYDPSKDYYITINALKTSVVSRIKRRHIKEEGLSTALYSGGKNYKDAGSFYIARTDNHVLGLKTIVVDIDCHNVESVDEIIAAKNALLNSDLFEGLPKPTAIIFSGRGFHIYYAIYETSVQINEIYKTIARKIAEKFQEAIEREMLYYYGFEVDATVSERISGLIRLPGTKNTKSGLYSEVCSFNKIKYDINELKDAFGIKIPAGTYKKKDYITNGEKTIANKQAQAINVISNKTYINNYKKMLTNRLSIIKECVKQNNRNSKEGCRNNYCFSFFNIMKQLTDYDTAFFEMQKFNEESFAHPLPDYELKNLVKSTSRVKWGFYRYTNEHFAEILSLDANEKIKYGLTGEAKKKDYFTKRKRIAQENRTAKQRRNYMILQTFLNTSSTKKAAMAGGVCMNTVRNIIKKNGNLIDNMNRKKKLARDRRTYNNFLIHKDLNKAAKAGKCCKATAKKIIEKYENLYYDIRNKIKEDILKNSDERFKQISRVDNRMLNEECDRLLDMKKQSYGKYFKEDFLYVKTRVSLKTGYDPDEITIAMAPYLLYEEVA